jgi:hypothetical protein
LLGKPQRVRCHTVDGSHVLAEPQGCLGNPDEQFAVFLNCIRIEVVEGGLELLFRGAILSDRFKGTAATGVEAATPRNCLRTRPGEIQRPQGHFVESGGLFMGQRKRGAISRSRRIVDSFFHSPDSGSPGKVPCEIRERWIVCRQTLHCLPNPAMQPRAPRTAQIVIQRLPDQGVHKAASVAAPCSLPDQLRATPFINYIEKAVFGHAAQVLEQGEVEFLPNHSRQPEDLVAILAQSA